jgi:RHS repeat-associated protein
MMLSSTCVTEVCFSRYRSIGKERDSESGNDYFGARYYGSSMGRFLSPDPHSGSRSNPQTLNKYTYGANNPLRNIDPTGMDCVYAGSDAAHSSIVRGDCRSEDDDGVFFDKHVNYLADDPNGKTIDAYTSPYTAANNPYNTPASNPWDGHYLAQQVFQGPGSGSFVGANTAVTYGAAAYAAAAAAAFFAPAAVEGAGAAASWTANATGLLGPATGRVFWSAIGSSAAAEWAEENGGTTLEMSPLGGFANWAQGYLPQSNFTGAAWNALSSGFASGAQGPVTYLQGAYLGNTWLNTELPILQQNGNPITTVPMP